MHRTRHLPRRLLLGAIAALALVLAGCGSAPGDPGADPDPDANGDWMLTSGHGPEGQVDIVDGHVPTMTVNGFQVSGHSGCNHFGLVEEEEQPEEWPTEFIGTMMACEPPEVMDQEAAFLAAMREVTEVRTEGEELTLSGPETELHFERATG